MTWGYTIYGQAHMYNPGMVPGTEKMQHQVCVVAATIVPIEDWPSTSKMRLTSPSWPRDFNVILTEPVKGHAQNS